MPLSNEERLATLENQMADTKGDIVSIFHKIDDLLFKLSAGRPGA